MTAPSRYAQLALDVLADLVQDERAQTHHRIAAAEVLLRHWPLFSPVPQPHATLSPATPKGSCPECHSENVEDQLDPAMRCRACGHAWIAEEDS